MQGNNKADHLNKVDNSKILKNMCFYLLVLGSIFTGWVTMKTKPLQNDWQKHGQDRIPLFDKVRS